MKRFLQNSVFITIIFIFLSIILTTEKSIGQLDPCPCDCDEILTDGNTHSHNEIRLLLVDGCYQMKISLKGCSGRRIVGIKFFTDNYDGDECLDQLFSVKDCDGINYGSYNPTEEGSLINPLVPPVEPCETEYYCYWFCPGIDYVICNGKIYDFYIQYIEDIRIQGSIPPCPPSPIRLAFEAIPDLDVKYIYTDFLNQLEIKPNPVSDNIIIILPNSLINKRIGYEIYNNIGISIYKNEIMANSNSITVPLQSQNSGIYIIKFECENQLIGFKKFIYTN